MKYPKLSPLKQIRRFRQCLDCCCGSTKLIRFCVSTESIEKNFDFFYSKMWRRSKDGLGKKL